MAQVETPKSSEKTMPDQKSKKNASKKDQEADDLMADLQHNLPTTETQQDRELDLITKPKDLQKRLHAENLKIDQNSQGSSQMNMKSKRITKDQKARPQQVSDDETNTKDK